MARKRLHVLISGKVQGVFFRASTRDRALELGLHGWVRNLPDGRVEALFEGESEGVDEALAWCRRGPPGSRPEGVEIYWEDARNDLGDFRVLF